MLINIARINLITVSVVLFKEHCWVQQHIWRTLSHLVCYNAVSFHEPLTQSLLARVRALSLQDYCAAYGLVSSLGMACSLAAAQRETGLCLDPQPTSWSGCHFLMVPGQYYGSEAYTSSHSWLLKIHPTERITFTPVYFSERKEDKLNHFVCTILSVMSSVTCCSSFPAL